MEVKIQNKTHYLLAWLMSGLFLVALYYIVTYQSIFLDSVIKTLKQLTANGFQFFFIVLVLLMTFNWSLEAVKWKILLQNQQRISFFLALKSVLMGLYSSFFLPKSLGTYWGRLAAFSNFNLLKTSFLVFANNVLNFWASVFLALPGLIYLSFYYSENQYLDKYYIVLAWVLFTIGVFILAYLWYHFKSSQGKMPFSFLDRWQAHFTFLLQIDFSKLLVISLIRHSVFYLQYVLLLSSFGVELSSLVFALVGVFYLLKMLIPSVNGLFDLGAREIGAVFVMSLAGIDMAVCVSAGILLWVLNVFIPSVAGGIWSWKRA